MRTVCARLLGLVVAATIAAWAAPARADEAPTVRRWVGTDLIAGSVHLVGSMTLLGMNVHGGWLVTPRLALGGRIPVAHARFGGESATALGNVTGELYYDLQSPRNSASWFSASLSVPTASKKRDRAPASGAMATLWLVDPGLYSIDTTTIRFAGHYRFGPPQRYLLVSAGLQMLYLDDTQDRLRAPLVIGGGLQLMQYVTAAASLTTLWLSVEDGDNDFLHVAEIGAGFDTGCRVDGWLGLYLPLDERYRSLFEARAVLARVSIEL